jgi:hypothetical protein
LDLTRCRKACGFFFAYGIPFPQVNGVLIMCAGIFVSGFEREVLQGTRDTVLRLLPIR